MTQEEAIRRENRQLRAKEVKKMGRQKSFICIDLKSFYASVECVERGLDPFKTNLVVADPTRSQSTICLAITPAMKKLGVKNRCRIHEIPADIEYITAMPRMQLYIDYSARIYSIYLRYISKEDIHVYSIDECFMDVTNYLSLYHMTEKEMLIVQDQVWNRVTINRGSQKSTRYYIDEFHLLLKEEQTAAYSVEIWKRFRKWGGIPTGITQNIKDLLASREIENIFENSDFILMLNQAAGDRQILAKQLNISPYQLSYVTNSGEGEGLLFYGNIIIPFKDKFDKSLKLYSLMTTKPEEVEERKKLEAERK